MGVALLCGQGCGERPRFSDHGLKKIEIRMDSERVGEVFGGARRRIEVPGHAWIDGETRRVTLEAAGATSIQAPKKSWDLKFQDGEWNGSSEVRLSAMTADPSLLRALVAAEVFRAAGVYTPEIEPVYIFLNETPLGLYLLIEKIRSDFFKKRGEALRRLYTAEGDSGFTPGTIPRIERYFSTKPSPSDFEPMIALAQTVLIEELGTFEGEVFKHIDRSSVVNYMAAAQIVNHWDGFNKNLHYIQTEKSFAFLLAAWDLDQVWRSDLTSSLTPWDGNLLFSRLMMIPSVKDAIEAKVSELLQGAASESNLEERVNHWKDVIRQGYESDPTLGRSGRVLDEKADSLMGDIRGRLAQLRSGLTIIQTAWPQ